MIGAQKAMRPSVVPINRAGTASAAGLQQTEATGRVPDRYVAFPKPILCGSVLNAPGPLWRCPTMPGRGRLSDVPFDADARTELAAIEPSRGAGKPGRTRLHPAQVAPDGGARRACPACDGPACDGPAIRRSRRGLAGLAGLRETQGPWLAARHLHHPLCRTSRRAPCGRRRTSLPAPWRRGPLPPLPTR